jgi:hypothetical protein
MASSKSFSNYKVHSSHRVECDLPMVSLHIFPGVSVHLPLFHVPTYLNCSSQISLRAFLTLPLLYMYVQLTTISVIISLISDVEPETALIPNISSLFLFRTWLPSRLYLINRV